MKWVPGVSAKEGMEGMATGGGSEFGVGADKKGGASV